MDFIDVEAHQIKKDEYNIRPTFNNSPSKDIIIREGKFIAVWDEEENIWKTSKDDVVRLVDNETKLVYDKKVQYKEPRTEYHLLKMKTNSTKIYKEFIDWTKNKEDTCKGKILNIKVKFSNDELKRSDYCSFKLPYAIEDGPREAYDEIVNVLYEPEELEKIEWAVGAVIAGDSKSIQKAIAIYGSPGTGKGTILDIISDMFTLDDDNNYVCHLRTKDLVKSNDNFGAAPLKENKLIMVDSDANLSKVEDNSVLNTIISHEKTRSNSKYGSDNYVKPIGMLFLATNYYIAMSDAKTGLKRRIIVAKSTGNKIEYRQFQKLMKQVKNEYGSIAYHCLEVYNKLGKDYYDDWEPTEMFEFSNPVYSWIQEEWKFNLSTLYPDGIDLNNAWIYFQKYCEDSGLKQGKKTDFKIDMIEYFVTKENCHVNGKKYRYFFVKLKEPKKTVKVKEPEEEWLSLKKQPSLLDKMYANEPAQYEVEYEPEHKQPERKWENVKTKLSDIDTSKVHYVKPSNIHHIFIDFDIKDEDGNKKLDLSLKAAKEWPETYAETSQSGNGLHLHYIYDGDVSKLAPDFDKHIEIKKCDGGSAFRRRLVKCNNIPIAHLKEGDLPLKEKKKVYNGKTFRDEKKLRDFIEACMRKEKTGATATEINLIDKVLNDMYDSGVPYDVSNLKPYLVTFAAGSTNQSDRCLKVVSNMKLKSDTFADPEEHDIPFDDSKPLVFFDIEVFPNLLLICWKIAGKGNTIADMINPTPDEIRYLFSNYRLVGYNNRRYDNHVIYGASLGLSNIDIYHLSKKLINGNAVDVGYREAWNLSYTDIWDYLPAPKKQKLKKWEIDLGIHHQELGYDWDEPVPKELWPNVIKYCHYDVEATEATWDATQGDFLARQILAELTGKTVNTSTNKLTQQLLFGDDKNPVNEFRYRNLAEPVFDMDEEMKEFLTDLFPEMMAKPHGPAKSLLPYFPSYRTEWKTLVDAEGKKKKKLISSYRDVENVGEGGRVWAKPGMYENVWTFDVTSMHPHSIMAEYLFGLFTRVFRELVYARVYIKHGELDKVRKLFNGRLIPFLDDPVKLEALPDAFKTAINAVYGQTKATFECILKDPRNKDNIVAKRGALFMIDLHHALEDIGAEVIHIKTDSIKVVNPTEEVKQFIIDFGKRYGYSFEVEHIFEKICLVNDAVYIAKMDKADEGWIKACKKAKAKGEPEPTRWNATGTEFAVPYVFKTLFSHENIEFKDLCEVKSSKNNIYLDFDETLKDVSFYEHCKDTRDKINRNIKTTKKAVSELDEISGMTDEELDAKIAEGHDYRFVGAIGLFCPVREGTAGAKMVTPNNVGKWSAPSGTKDYRWKEAEIVDANGLQDTIDVGYFEDLVTNAIKDISKFGDFESFAA